MKHSGRYVTIGIAVLLLFVAFTWEGDHSCSVSGCTVNHDDGTHTEGTKNIESVSAEEFKNLIDSKTETYVILDIRTKNEYNQGHIKGAEQLDFYKKNFKEELSKLDRDKRYFIYCRSGHRSANALKTMEGLGFTEVYNLKRGINDWGSEGYDFVK